MKLGDTFSNVANKSRNDMIHNFNTGKYMKFDYFIELAITK